MFYSYCYLLSFDLRNHYIFSLGCEFFCINLCVCLYMATAQ